MRRVGLIFLAVGLAGFLFASVQKSRHENRAEEAVVSAAAGTARYGWETARWLLAGMGLMGLVFIALPGKPA
jgi:hypothetical protein